MKEIIVPYNREAVLQYAHIWANKRNPAYTNFEKMGGDCTNFVSQSIFAGSKVMNYTPTYGWYYINSQRRSASWTGVNFLYNFLIKNKGAGPFAEEVSMQGIMIGDIVQLSFRGNDTYKHSLVVVEVGTPMSLSNIRTATHTIDRDNYVLSNYVLADNMRFLHIKGVRK
ncbi:MAG TPA: amidase [Clostridiales bacterium]|nr:MAG: amidase [Clostridiales bacterium GWD2_32_19]HCC08242.1 amidase [Clostridiales bacterium]